jgi:long-chain acyl-CoA synthetase
MSDEQRMRLIEMLDQSRRDGPEHEAVVCGTVRLSYADLSERVDRLAAGLVALGARRWSTGRRPEHELPSLSRVLSGGGSIWDGARPAESSPRPARTGWDPGRQRVRRAVDRSTISANAGSDSSATAGLRQIVVLADEAPGGAVAYEAPLSEATSSIPPLVRGPEDLLYLFYTSGTTGQPKGVMLSERSIIFAVETCQRNVHFTAADRYLHSVSLGHRPAIGFLFATLLERAR